MPPRSLGLALLRQLVVLKLNNNRLGEECTFTLQRMAEKNTDLNRALTARAGSNSSRVMEPASTSLEGVELFTCLQVSRGGAVCWFYEHVCRVQEKGLSAVSTFGPSLVLL